MTKRTPLRWSLTRKLLLSTLLGAAAMGLSAKELSFWSMWNEPEPQAKALRSVMAAYTRAHPDVTFKVVWNGRQNQTKLRSALQAGAKVDFMDQDGDQLFGGLQAAGAGLEITQDMDPAFKDSLLPGALDIYARNGRVYSVPYVYNTVNFWYNRELMQKAGASVPKTWDELLGLCSAVQKVGKSALVIEGNVSDYNMLYFSHLLERIYGANSMVRLFEDKTGNGWTQPGVLQAVQMARALWDRGCIPKDARGFQYPAGQQTIALGDSMGALVGSWLPTELSESAGKDFPWGAFNFPAVKNGKGQQTDLQVALLSMMVLKTAPNPREAVDFIKFVVSEQAQKILVTEGQVGATRRAVAWPAALADAEKSAREATALSNFGGGLKMLYPDFTATVLAPEFNKMFLGEGTPQQLVNTLATKTREFWAGKK
ncbi:carbohydrate ABC transporter substrate-binding protein [Verminephrobacter aporrectodeae subsp. tuberculatae]|uniref:Carbohydrate ABC transporter substrate-binding protein n=1 Tax=Verminephrobacter aporrectodeae subsp. tuberculatae TaxID=1110392 RepID=A0ABT3KRK3_9BURK|nr:ABC transporter substrate-binding protein [Verminephrobacter aporrectodeae]MCW5320942.1 carbohydrate ABC transporter substrate-binding protein [Verminephrobacter aporrectodeae subsp. tuberculatae]